MSGLSRLPRREIYCLGTILFTKVHRRAYQGLANTQSARFSVYHDIFDPSPHRCRNAEHDKRERPDDSSAC